MQSESLEGIQQGLSETRENLAHWIETTPEGKRAEQCCGGDEACLQEHLHTIDQSLAKIEDGTFGICEVCHEPVDLELLRMDYTNTVCLGHYTEEELRQLESELELSQVVQRGLLPQEAPSIPGLALAAFSRPAQIVSGDYFDFVRFNDGGHGIVMADVSGHGMAAGMLMSSLQTAFQTLVPSTDSPLHVLERINHLYAHNINFTTFVTIFFAKFAPETRTLTYSNAGHTSGLVFRASDPGEILLNPTGPAIGLMEGFGVQSKEIQLNLGDTLVLYTDGVTEASNAKGEFFGIDRLTDIARENHGLAPEDVIQKILLGVRNFADSSPLLDDITVLVGKAV